jgi:hypothetical protein
MQEIWLEIWHDLNIDSNVKAISDDLGKNVTSHK